MWSHCRAARKLTSVSSNVIVVGFSISGGLKHFIQVVSRPGKATHIEGRLRSSRSQPSRQTILHRLMMGRCYLCPLEAQPLTEGGRHGWTRFIRRLACQGEAALAPRRPLFDLGNQQRVQAGRLPSSHGCVHIRALQSLTVLFAP